MFELMWIVLAVCVVNTLYVYTALRSVRDVLKEVRDILASDEYVEMEGEDVVADKVKEREREWELRIAELELELEGEERGKHVETVAQEFHPDVRNIPHDQINLSYKREGVEVAD